MEHLLRGELRASATGGKLYSFVNAMQAEGICCRGQQCQGNIYRFRIYHQSRKAVERLAAQYGVTLQLTPRRTLRQLLHLYRFRFGIPVGVLLGLGLSFYCSNVVMTIDVIGNESISETEILSILGENGIRRGAWIPSVDFSSCEHLLRADIEELAWVGMRHTGNRLVIEVMERTPMPEMLEDRTPCNVVAARDAQIVSFTVQSGQVARLVGEPVRKGELLINGVILDEVGHVAIHHAMGSVIGIYEQEEVFSCPYTQQMRRPTGEKTTRKSLDLFTWHLPLGKGENPYADSIQTTSYNWFSLFGKELPIGIYRETYHEYRVRELTLTPEEASVNLQEQVQRYEENFLFDAEILDKKTTALETEDGIQWTVTYTLQGEIGMQQELYLQD